MPKFYMTCTVIFDQQLAVSVEAASEEEAVRIVTNPVSDFRQDLEDEIQRDLPSDASIHSISFSRPTRSEE